MLNALYDCQPTLPAFLQKEQLGRLHMWLLLSPARSGQLKHPLSLAGKADDRIRQPPA